MLNAKLDALLKRMDKVNVNAVSTLSSSCELYQGGHPIIECQMMKGMTTEGVNYVGNFKGPQNQVYGNIYNPNWRNYPNLSWSNQENNQWRP